ncbi:MAG: GNAT family N-acetyltransferase [Acidobacteria bacterium]|nr:GNAT family N-acetyltransferase [Acidobacteriota bacterium]
MATITLRPCTEADEPFLFEVYASSRDRELAAVPWPAGVKVNFLRGQYELQKRHYRTAFANALFAVVEHDGVPIGRFYGWHGLEHSVLIEITLLPPWRGQGIGGELVARFVEEAGQRVTLHVEESNPARRLYERFGFQPTGESNGPHIKMARG